VSSTAPLRARPPGRTAVPLPWRLLVALAVALPLVAGVLGGLQRAGIAPWPQGTAQAALLHAALMIGGWLGTVIGLERAVALKTRLARSAPLLSALGALALLTGATLPGAWLLWAAATAFVAASVQVLQRQRAAHTVALALAAVAWWLGNTHWLLHAQGPDAGTLAAWFAFLVLTIAAERLELTRLMRRHALAQPLFFGAVALVMAAVLLGLVQVQAGGVAFGAALLLLAAWLAAHDVARITLRSPGLPRYMATALLAGYAWLAMGGVAWAAMALGAPTRDAALHAIGLGFVLSMVMAHAPVILPAVAGLKLQFGRFFYVPLALLHASLAWRLLAAPALGALANALALVLFALTVLGAALAWRRAHRS